MPSPSTVPVCGPHLSSTSVLRALAREVQSVKLDCHDLEIVVGEVFNSAPQGHLLVKLQAFDLLIQRLAGAAVVLEALADQMPLAALDGDTVLRDVPLSSLVSRLSGEDPRSLPPFLDMEIW